MRRIHRLTFRTKPKGGKNGERFEGEGVEESTSRESFESEIPGITSALESVSRSLREGFLGIGISRPLLLGNTDLYKLAVTDLVCKITQAPIPDNSKSGAVEELSSLSLCLDALFGGKFSTKLMDTYENGRSIIDGYFNDPTDSTIRISTITLPHHYYSNNRKVIIRPNTQILMKKIAGKNTRGQAVAEEDGGLRIGLRDYDRTWVISIDSGVKNKEGRWRVINPLSQAIEAMKNAGLLPDEGKPYTYHYITPPITSLVNDKYSNEGFSAFNLAIGRFLINKSIRRNH